jgi:RNA polymerase subunit RPABC4/transcription elongation factor Spt4
MKELCEVCGEREFTQLCDYASGTGIITSVDFRELTETCDKKLCRQCSTSLWENCEICPEHTEEVKKKLFHFINFTNQ